MKGRWIVLFILAVGAGLCPGCRQDSTEFSKENLAIIPDTLPYSPVYDGHLQGFCTDFDQYLYWSHTRQLVKTDLQGKVLKVVDVQNHHGDLDFFKGEIYVAVNFGQFNQPPGLADSWVYVYDAADLQYKRKYAVPEVVHGAGGLAINDGRIMVVGGLPEKDRPQTNYVYQYDLELNFIKRHDLSSGYTYLGIQTANYFRGLWYFGCYGSSRLNVMPKVLIANENDKGELELEKSVAGDRSYGMIGLSDGQFLYSGRDLNKVAVRGTLEEGISSADR